MTTGYTRILEDDPDTTFAEFAMRCARESSVLASMHDEPLDAELPETIEPDERYRTELDRAYSKMRELEMMTEEEAERRAVEEHGELLRSREVCRARWKAQNAIYLAMLVKVEAWVPPTSEHDGVKVFMRKRLESSIHPEYDWPVVKFSGKTWLDQSRKKAANEVEIYSKKWKEAQDRARLATEWLQALRASLKEEG